VVCLEFGCTPTEADQQDVWRVNRIMSLRRFAEAWAQVEGGVPQNELRKTEGLETLLLVKMKRAKGELD